MPTVCLCEMILTTTTMMKKEKTSISLQLRLLFCLVTPPPPSTATVASTLFSVNPNVHPLKHMFPNLDLMHPIELMMIVMGKATE
jgi:hypothetical protein